MRQKTRQQMKKERSSLYISNVMVHAQKNRKRSSFGFSQKQIDPGSREGSLTLFDRLLVARARLLIAA